MYRHGVISIKAILAVLGLLFCIIILNIHLSFGRGGGGGSGEGGGAGVTDGTVTREDTENGGNILGSRQSDILNIFVRGSGIYIGDRRVMHEDAIEMASAWSIHEPNRSIYIHIESSALERDVTRLRLDLEHKSLSFFMGSSLEQ